MVCCGAGVLPVAVSHCISGSSYYYYYCHYCCCLRLFNYQTPHLLLVSATSEYLNTPHILTTPSEAILCTLVRTTQTTFAPFICHLALSRRPPPSPRLLTSPHLTCIPPFSELRLPTCQARLIFGLRNNSIVHPLTLQTIESLRPETQ